MQIPVYIKDYNAKTNNINVCNTGWQLLSKMCGPD